MSKIELDITTRLQEKDSQIIIIRKITENKEIIDPIEEIIFPKINKSSG